MKKLQPFISVIVASSLTGGCMVGPNYHRPAVQTPSVYRDPAANPQVQAQAASLRIFPGGRSSATRSCKSSFAQPSSKTTICNSPQSASSPPARSLAVTRSSLFPQVSGNANFAGGKEGTFQTKYNFLMLTADAAFQLDLFGKLRRATEAARAQLLATEAARQTVILTLVSDVASDYFNLLQLDLQLKITHQTVDTQEDSVKLTSLRLDHGVATKLDVLQAQQTLDTAYAHNS